MVIKVRVNYGYAGTNEEFVECVDDDLTEDELDEYARELVMNQVEYSYEVEK